MNWNDIRYFLAVSRAGKLSRACAELGVNQATVGRRIAALETALSAKLFDKSPKGYSLTEAGERLIPVAEQMESMTVSALAEMGTREENLSGVIRLGAPDGVATYLVAEGAVEFLRKHPDLEIQLVALPRTFSLSKREADFSITVSAPDQGRLKIRKISDFYLRLYAHEDFLARKGTISDVKDLRELRNIGYISDMIFDKELDYLPLIDPEIKPSLTSTSVHVQLNSVLLGGGVAVLPDFLAKRHKSLKPILEKQVQFKRAFWMVIHEDYARLERISRISNHLYDHIREHLVSLIN